MQIVDSEYEVSDVFNEGRKLLSTSLQSLF